MMKVCIFNGDMSRGGGTERITQLLANALAQDEKYDVWVLNCNNEKGTSYYPLDEKVKMATLPAGSVLKKIFALRKFLKSNKIDVIINVDVMLGIFSLPATFGLKTEVIAWEMFNIGNDIGSKHTKTIRKLSLRRCAYYINQTKGDMQAFLKTFKVRCPITYIYDPCEANEEYTAYDQKSKIIMTAGHFFYTKGYDLALEVARLVFDAHPDWQWRFIGDGVHFEELKEKAKEYGLENNVIFAGRTNQIAEEYKRAALYVMTSRTEGFGLVLTEAKSFNLPTLAFDVDFGPREIIQHGHSGYLVKPFDIERMAGCICELIENEEERALFASRAKDNLGMFSEGNFVKAWKEVLEQIKGK